MTPDATPRWHLVVNGEPACSQRVLLDDRRLPFAIASCSNHDRARVERLAADVRALHPEWTVEVRQEGCDEEGIV